MATPADLPQKRVLVVDDSKFVRTTFATILKSSFDVREAADGEAAWQAIAADASICMVFTDLDMPALDGFALLKRIRGADDERVRSLPVVVISGHERPEEKQRARSLGANDFIGKSADAPEVLARLDNVLSLVRASRRKIDDTLTGTLTPHYLITEGRKRFAHARRHSRDLSVMAVRLDSYDEIARTAGKDIADVVLARVGKLLTEKVRADDSVARTAQAMFMVVAAATGGAQMLSLAQRLQRELDYAKVTYRDRPLKFAASFGVASLPADEANCIEDLMRLALQRLQVARPPQAAQPQPQPFNFGSPASTLPADLERALRYFENLDIARLGNAADEFARRLKRIAKAIQAKRR